MQAHELGGRTELVVDQHAVREPDFPGIAAEDQGFDVDVRGCAYLVEVTQVGFNGVERASGDIEVFATDTEMVLHDPGSIAQGNEVVGFVEVAVKVEPAILKRFRMKPENRHCYLRCRIAASITHAQATEIVRDYPGDGDVPGRRLIVESRDEIHSKYRSAVKGIREWPSGLEQG